jgi:thiosulfate dehydrogenase [quinone] large subunit
MGKTATITRGGTYVLTAVAAALFVALCWLFGDGLLVGPLWNGASWIDSPLITYLLTLAIVAAGVAQANRLPRDGLALVYPPDVATPGQVDEPLFAKVLFGNVFTSLIWLPLRLFVGRDWLSAGLHKVGVPGWTETGAALAGFWKSAIAVNEQGEGKIAYDWYRNFLQFMLDNGWQGWFAKLVVAGEILIGLGLIVGGLVGLAAFFGTLLYFNFGLAGSASSNPVLFGLGVLLVLAWRTAGYWGLDRWLLPWLGTPWERGATYGAAFGTATTAPPKRPPRG